MSDWSSDVCSSDLAPVDVIGTGSFLPESWSETYATADIVAYDGQPRVKVGGEFLLRTPDGGDRKSVVSGKRVSVRVDLGGRRIMKTTNTKKQTHTRHKRNIEIKKNNKKTTR